MCSSSSAGLVVQKVRYSYRCTWPEWSACSAAPRGAHELGSILLLGFRAHRSCPRAANWACCSSSLAHLAFFGPHALECVGVQFEVAAIAFAGT